MHIKPFVISKDKTSDEVVVVMLDFCSFLATGKYVTFDIRKGTLIDAPKVEYKNGINMFGE